MAIVNSNINIVSTPISTDYYINGGSGQSDVRNYLAETGNNLLNGYSSAGTYTIFDNGLLQIRIKIDMAYNQWRLQSLILKNLQTNQGVTINNSNFRNSLYLCLGYDDTNRTSFYYMVGQFDYNGSWSAQSHGEFTSHQEDLYLAISGSQAPTYTWQSVAGVSGRLGYQSFTTIIDESSITGGSQTFALSGLRLASVTSMQQLGANVPRGQSAKVIYSGVHYAELEKTNLLYDTISLYLVGNITRKICEVTNIDLGAYLGFIIDDEQGAARIGIFTPQYDQAHILTGYAVDFTDSDYSESDMYAWLQGGIEAEDPEVNEGNEGTDPNYQPDIAVTGISKPAYGAINTGFTRMYRVSDDELRSLSSYLWTSDFVTNVKKFFNDPREIIVGLSIMPVTPTTGTAQIIQAGGISTGIYGQPLTDQYVFDTFGYCEVKAEKGNFLDYDPYTKVTAHLPFVGSHSLSVSDVMGKKLTLKYIFDFLSGSCVAEIDVDGNPHYFFGGSCGMQIPTSSEDFSKLYSSVLSAGATLGGTLATIATGGLTAPLAIGAGVNMLSNGMNSSPHVDFSSGSGSINGMIGCKTAFLTIEKPKEKIVGEQHKYLGRPSYMTRTLENCSGYTKCMSVHLDNVPCTATERAEIERLLLGGVRIKTGSETPEYTPTTDTDHGVIFLKCVSDMDVIGKSWDSEDIETIEGKLLYEQSFLKPVFVFNGNFKAYNYCYIPEFDRFYYITEQIAKTGNITEVHMECDVLQSWKAEILSNKAVIERSAKSSNNNAYFSDSMYWTQADKEVKTVPFTTEENGQGDELVFEIPADNYILTIAGG